MAPLRFNGQTVRLILDGQVDDGTAGVAGAIRKPAREPGSFPSAECMRAILAADLSAPEKSLLCSITWAQAESLDGLARVSVMRLGEWAGLSSPRVQTHLKTLEASGVVEVVSRSRGGSVDGGAARTHVLRVAMEQLLTQRKYPLPEPAIASADAGTGIMLRHASPTPVQSSLAAEEPQRSPPTLPTQRCCECGRMAGVDDRQISTPKSHEATQQFRETTPKSLGSTPNSSEATPKFQSSDSKAVESRLPNLKVLAHSSFTSNKNTTSSSWKPPETLESQQASRGGGAVGMEKAKTQDQEALRLLLEFRVFPSKAEWLSRELSAAEVRAEIRDVQETCGTARSMAAVLVRRLETRVRGEGLATVLESKEQKLERAAAMTVRRLLDRLGDSRDRDENEYVRHVRVALASAWNTATGLIRARVVPVASLLQEPADRWELMQRFVAALPEQNWLRLNEDLPRNLIWLLPIRPKPSAGAVR